MITELLDKLVAWVLKRQPAHVPACAVFNFQTRSCRQQMEMMAGIEAGARELALQHGERVDGLRPAWVYYELAVLLGLKLLTTDQVAELLALPTPANQCRTCTLHQATLFELRKSQERAARRKLLHVAANYFKAKV